MAFETKKGGNDFMKSWEKLLGGFCDPRALEEEEEEDASTEASVTARALPEELELEKETATKHVSLPYTVALFFSILAWYFCKQLTNPMLDQ